MATLRKRDLERRLKQYRAGKITKEGVEALYGVTNAKGKWITRQWQNRLGEDSRSGRKSPTKATA